MSINGALFRRFRAECERQDVPMQVVTDALIAAELDRLESLPKKRTRLVRSTGKRTFQVRHLTFLRIQDAAHKKGLRVREYSDELVNAMLDKAGAP